MKNLEQIPVNIFDDDKLASKAVAERIAALIRARQKTARPLVLGLATGHTMVNLYRELARMHTDEGLDFSKVITFNVDEYWPINPAAIQAHAHLMNQMFFKHVNIPPENIHLPRGDVSAKKIEIHCREYEKKIHAAGGIDLQILGISNSGHIGFNELTAGSITLTRRVRLDLVTRKEAAGDFFGEENIPEFGITMGMGTLLKARQICLLAFGEHKTRIIKRIVEGEVAPNLVSTYLQQHPDVTFYLGRSAAAELTRIATPWILGQCRWDDNLKRRAVIWLARKLDKAILKLTKEDYVENGLAGLLRVAGGSYGLNIEVFRRQMSTITGWPGGKNSPKRVLIFSPHPDDDVISMAGTMIRLIEQKHHIDIAYMVSGFLSVFDHTVLRYTDFVHRFNQLFGHASDRPDVTERHTDKFLLGNKAAQPDSPEIQKIKALIRRTEAIDAAGYAGLSEEHLHFLDLPFYNTGTAQKLTAGAEDVNSVLDLLKKVKPQMLFAAGDLSDPHGTHRICFDVLLTALDKYIRPGSPAPELWLYRGAWQEWPVEQVDMAVPLSPDELRRKRFAIFRHESQKDRAMFPGPYDSREFWQRAEERNITTAKIYDALGLPEYHALESFVKFPLKSH